ncbi:MAG: preprotein translocase subunit YajC [Nocardioidaceae bacterium]
MDSLVSLLPFVLIAALFWLLMIRPAQRRQREARSVQRSADVGTEVLLTAGIYARVVEAGDADLVVEVSPGTTMKVVRAAVLRVVSDETVPEPDLPGAAADPDAPSDDPVDVQPEVEADVRPTAEDTEH